MVKKIVHYKSVCDLCGYTAFLDQHPRYVKTWSYGRDGRCYCPQCAPMTRCRGRYGELRQIEYKIF